MNEWNDMKITWHARTERNDMKIRMKLNWNQMTWHEIMFNECMDEWMNQWMNEWNDWNEWNEMNEMEEMKWN